MIIIHGDGEDSQHHFLPPSSLPPYSEALQSHSVLSFGSALLSRREIRHPISHRFLKYVTDFKALDYSPARLSLASSVQSNGARALALITHPGGHRWCHISNAGVENNRQATKIGFWSCRPLRSSLSNLVVVCQWLMKINVRIRFLVCHVSRLADKKKVFRYLGGLWSWALMRARGRESVCVWQRQRERGQNNG